MEHPRERPTIAMGIETEHSIYAESPDPSERRNFNKAVDALVSEVFDSPQFMGPQFDRSFGGGFTQFLHNGARLYNDIQAPEYSTPECQNPYTMVVHEVAGGRIVQQAAKWASETLGYPLTVHRKNSDGHGHAYGNHENYCIRPKLFNELMREPVNPSQTVLATFLIVRQVLTGAGKVGVECHDERFPFQLSQRWDFCNQFRANVTRTNRPLFQTRNEPHANAEKWRRLHYIMGDANMCEISTYLKMGLTSLMLMLLQDYERASYNLPTFMDDVEHYNRVGQVISWDVSFVGRPAVEMTQRTGSDVVLAMSTPEILQRYIDRLAEYVETRPFRDERERTIYRDVIERSQEYLGLIRAGKAQELYGKLDWPTKYWMLQRYMDKKGRSWVDATRDEHLQRRLRLIADHAYTWLDSEHGTYFKLLRAGHITKLVDESEVRDAMFTPPPGRPQLRTMVINKLLPSIVPMGIDWDEVVVPNPRDPGKNWTIKLQDPMLVVSPLIRALVEDSTDVRQREKELKEAVKLQSTKEGL